jgi:hypothetical protein
MDCNPRGRESQSGGEEKRKEKEGQRGLYTPFPGLPRPAVSAKFSRREASELDCARGGGDVAGVLRVKG